MNETVSAPRYRLASFPLLMTVSVLTRLLVNTANQLFNPFLTIIAAGLGMDVIRLGQLLGLRSLMAVFSPLFGSLADRWGYRRIMRLELLIGIAGLVLIGSSVEPWMTVAGMLLLGLGFYAFVPTLRAYLAEQLPYNRRARGFGILEYSWALSGIVGLFVMGQVIAVAGWRAPFFVLAAGLVMAWFVFAELPPTGRVSQAASHSSSVSRRRWFGGWSHLVAQLRHFFTIQENRASTWGAILSGTVANFGLLHIAVIYGGWLATEYGLSAEQLGTVALVIGCADLCGSGLASIVADGLGKRRGVLLGWAIALVVTTLLPWLDRGLLWAVGALVLLRAASEFAIICHMSLVSGQSTTQRGKILTLAFAVSIVGGTLASFTGPPAFTAYGVWGLGPVTALALFVAMVIMLRWVQEITDDR
ncbi:MAG: MFS transporter [Caldilinea sp. CFX5]|nr:MFS transporter [Caldilinea sp. CFX5]